MLNKQIRFNLVYVMMPVVNIVSKEWVEDDRDVDGDDSQELESR